MRELITTGRKIKPLTVLLHGVHGIGKTTFGTNSPKPIYITGEEIEEIESAKFPKCNSWEDFLNYSKFVRDEDHDFKTLVIDTVDSIETLLHQFILKENDAKDMARAMGGYGKAYTYATQLFLDYRDNYLVPIREKRGMNVILLCHSTKNKFEDPLNLTSYDVYEMKLHKSGKGVGVYTVFSEWVSIIAFANFKVFTVKDNDKSYATGQGERVLYCTPKPAYDAKNRFNLPDEMPLDFMFMAEKVKEFYSTASANNKDPETEALKNEINELINLITDANLKNETAKNVQAVGDDPVRLAKARDYIKGVVNG